MCYDKRFPVSSWIRCGSDVGVELPTADREVGLLLSQSFPFLHGHEPASSAHLIDMGHLGSFRELPLHQGHHFCTNQAAPGLGAGGLRDLEVTGPLELHWLWVHIYLSSYLP